MCKNVPTRELHLRISECEWVWSWSRRVGWEGRISGQPPTKSFLKEKQFPVGLQTSKFCHQVLSLFKWKMPSCHKVQVRSIWVYLQKWSQTSSAAYVPSRPPCFCEHAVNAPYVAGHFQPLLSLLPPLSWTPPITFPIIVLCAMSFETHLQPHSLLMVFHSGVKWVRLSSRVSHTSCLPAPLHFWPHRSPSLP